MKQELYYKYLSRPRYNRYLIATGNNKKRAAKLYNGNLRLSQAFHPFLSQFEVILRNSVNTVLTTFFGDPDWIINQKTGFMNDPSLRVGHYFLKNSVQKTENRLTRAGTPITSGKIISDQMFGFWTSFYTPAHYSLVRGRPIQVFTHKPPVENRASIFNKLEDIREFRNRINHCEPICFDVHRIDCTYPLDVRNKILDLVEWIEPDLIPFFQSIDNIESKANKILSI